MTYIGPGVVDGAILNHWFIQSDVGGGYAAGAPETKLQWEKCHVRSREKQPKKEKKRSDIKMMMMYRNEQ